MHIVYLYRYYASGVFQRRIADIYRIGPNECAAIIQEVSEAIIKELASEVMVLSEENWIRVANEFNFKWQLPNCVGAFDGKHIHIKKPYNAGSQFFNYKRFHSVVLMVAADANYKFLSIDVGGLGSEGDGQMFNRIKIGRMAKEDDPELHLPPDAPVGNWYLPYYFIGDDAFPIMKRMMKPYSPTRTQPLTEEQEIYNYRISRARRCVENAFGILGAKWSCTNTKFYCQPDKVKKIVAACCLLHNFLLNRSPETYIPDEFKDSYREEGDFTHATWRRNSGTDRPQIIPNNGRNLFQQGNIIRDNLQHFFNSQPGSVPFQARGARIQI